MTSLGFFDYTFPTGHTFSPSERVLLSSSLPLLATQTKRRQLKVWGKIYGYKADYTVVEAFDDDLVAEPELYYSLDDGQTFTLLGTPSSVLGMVPSLSKANALELEEWKGVLILNMRGPFAGDPAYEYRVTTPFGGGLLSVKESVRLALFVEEHDYQCRVAPRGAYITADRQSYASVQRSSSSTLGNVEIVVNTAFRGLTRGPDGALSLRNYYHLRAPNPYRRLLSRNQNNLFAKSNLEKIAENPHLDAVFESLSDDIPSGTWQVRYDAFHGAVVGKNMRFPGSLFYHVPDSNVFGNIYMGDGDVNINAAFEL